MSPLVRTGLAAALLAVPVALETLIADFGDHTWGELVFAGTQLAGWLVVLTVVRELDRGALARSLRIGRRLVLAGVLAQVGFALVYGVLVAAGVDPEGAFALFALGFLLLTIGGLTWGIARLRRDTPLLGWGLVAVAVLGLLAIAIGIDPFHDLFLLGSYLAWLPVGRGSESQAADGRRVLTDASR